MWIGRKEIGKSDTDEADQISHIGVLSLQLAVLDDFRITILAFFSAIFHGSHERSSFQTRKDGILRSKRSVTSAAPRLYNMSHFPLQSLK
jgi:hypothetical protein